MGRASQGRQHFIRQESSANEDTVKKISYTYLLDDPVGAVIMCPREA